MDDGTPRARPTGTCALDAGPAETSASATPAHTQRRLAVIVSADVVGYSTLMENDENGTLARLRELRSEVIDPELEACGGVVRKLMGDGMLVEFGSIHYAVECAVRVQERLHEEPHGRGQGPAPEGIRFRIGINICDIISEGDEIYGDGINLAARLQALAPPGGICISESAHQSLGADLARRFLDLGLHRLKNLSRPVRIFRFLAETDDAASIAAVWRQRPATDKPSIAILPFEGPGDPGADYFAAGIAEELTSDLARFPWFFVVASGSAFAASRETSDVRALSRTLGVRYLITGSIRPSHDRIRVSVQLLEGTTGHHVWAQRYERSQSDVLEVQDQICQDVIASLAPQCLSAEMTRAKRKEVASLDAWDYTLRARWHLAQFSREGNRTARELLMNAIELDPTWAAGHTYISIAHIFDAALGFAARRDDAVGHALESAQTAVEMDEGDALAQCAVGTAQFLAGHYEPAIARLHRAIDLNPNLANAHACLGFALVYSGCPDLALPEFDRAIALSPRDPFLAVWFTGVATAALLRGDDRGAVEWAERALIENAEHPYPGAYRILAAGLAGQRRMREARVALDALRARRPGLTLEEAVSRPPLRRPADRARLRKALASAGLDATSRSAETAEAAANDGVASGPSCVAGPPLALDAPH